MARHRNKSAYAKNSVMRNSGKWSPVVIIQPARTPEELRKERVLKELQRKWEVVIKEDSAIAD